MILTNPWILSLYGWVFYNLWILNKRRKQFDKNNDGVLSWKEFVYYIKVEMIPILISIWVIPFGVYEADVIWVILMDLIGKSWEFGNWVYVIMGCLAGLIQFIVDKIKG